MKCRYEAYKTRSPAPSVKAVNRRYAYELLATLEKLVHIGRYREAARTLNVCLSSQSNELPCQAFNKLRPAAMHHFQIVDKSWQQGKFFLDSLHIDLENYIDWLVLVLENQLLADWPSKSVQLYSYILGNVDLMWPPDQQLLETSVADLGAGALRHLGRLLLTYDKERHLTMRPDIQEQIQALPAWDQCHD